MTVRAARACAAALALASLAGCPAPAHRQAVRAPPVPLVAPEPRHDEPALAGVIHVVRRGETLWRIARTYGIDPADLMETNGISDPTAVPTGLELFVPGAVHGLPSPPPDFAPSAAYVGAVFAWVGDLGKPLATDRIDLATMKSGHAEPAKDEAPALELVSCGRPFPNHELAIVGPDGAPLGERQVGEIWLRGPSVTAGYFGDPEATAETFGGGFLRTGDLGYRAEGHVYICGRSKDLIILNGKNHYPQDIERVASGVSGVRKGCLAAFACHNGETGTEDLVLIAETRETDRKEQERIVVNEQQHIVTLPVDWLSEISIVDTPGTNAIIRSHELITTQFVPRSDLVLFLTSADRPFTESERLFLERIRDWGKKIVIIPAYKRRF